MDIQPIYVTFEQAKLLNNEIRNRKKIYLNKDGNEVTDEFIVEKYVSKGLKIPPIDDAKSVYSVSFFSRPEQWMVIEWLRIKHKIWINVPVNVGEKYSTPHYYAIITDLVISVQISWNNKLFDSPQEAKSAAIDYCLKELI